MNFDNYKEFIDKSKTERMLENYINKNVIVNTSYNRLIKLLEKYNDFDSVECNQLAKDIIEDGAKLIDLNEVEACLEINEVELVIPVKYLSVE